MADGQSLLQWVTPVLLIAFGAMFIAVWRNERQHRSALIIGLSYFGGAAAFIVELSFVDHDGVSAAFFTDDALYLTSAACFAAGIAVRAAVKPPIVLYGLVCVTGTGLGCWFGLNGFDTYRVQAVTFGTAFLFATPLYLCRHHMQRKADRVLAVLIALMSASIASSSAFLITDVRSLGLTYEQSTFSASMSAIMNVSSVLVAITLMTDYMFAITDRLRASSLQDPLTGLLNRRGFEAEADSVIRDAIAKGHTGVLIVADLDRFKTVNDEFGHTAGDQVIRALAETMRHTLPVGTLVSRLGGEEFCALLPDTSLQVGHSFGEQIRQALPEVATSVLQHHKITVSIGVAEFDGTYSATFKKADAAMFEAKDAGRNRVMSVNTTASFAA